VRASPRPLRAGGCCGAGGSGGRSRAREQPAPRERDGLLLVVAWISRGTGRPWSCPWRSRPARCP
jgi:hypothetical protein